MGLHLCVIRHWLAGNLIITQGGQFISTFDEHLGHYTSLIINLVQFLFVILGLVWFQKYIGKRPMFLFSVSLLSLINLALGVSTMLFAPTPSLIIMIVYMIVYGGSFISPIWSYPSEVIPATQSQIPNIVHWTALGLEILIPPLIAGAMPRNNAYPVFYFFGGYGLISFIHVFRCLRETDGLTYNQIIKSFY